MEIVKITKDNLNLEKGTIDKAVKLYIEIYSSPPYNENFEYENVMKEFMDYIHNGLLLLTILSDSKVIGFLATSVGHPCNDEKLKNDLIFSGIDPCNDIYFSEFGVEINYRRHGIGKKMLDTMLHHHLGKKIYLRTAKYNNDKVINYYKRAGFKVIDAVERVLNKRTDGTIGIDERIYMLLE